MRAACAIVVAACVAVAAARVPHLRRAHPTPTLSAQVAAHHHHVRSHRSPTAITAPQLLPVPHVAIFELSIATQLAAIDRDAVALVARGPPVA